MSNQLHNELKKEFQLERMILFSDAVFAIAITLLVIEIKIPEIHEHITDSALLAALGHLAPKFLGFVTSFALVGFYWTVHHRMFGYVTAYDRKILWLNLCFLFFIVLMPFSTGFYGEYSGKEFATEQLKVPMTFYVLNYFFVGLFNYIMWRYISNPAHKLTEPPIDPLTLKLAKARAVVLPLTFLMMIPVAYLVNVVIGSFVPILIPMVMKITKKVITRKHKQLHLSTT